MCSFISKYCLVYSCTVPWSVSWTKILLKETTLFLKAKSPLKQLKIKVTHCLQYTWQSRVYANGVDNDWASILESVHLVFILSRDWLQPQELWISDYFSFRFMESEGEEGRGEERRGGERRGEKGITKTLAWELISINLFHLADPTMSQLHAQQAYMRSNFLKVYLQSTICERVLQKT